MSRQLERLLTEDIGNKYAMEFCIFQQLCQLYPVVNLGEAVGLVVGMPPESWGLVPTTWMFGVLSDLMQLVGISLVRRVTHTS